MKNPLRLRSILLLLASLLLALDATSGPLAPVDIDAIVAEALHRADADVARATPWQTLTPDKLTRMLPMPEMAKLPYRAREQLIRQASAWDSIPFEKPSDAPAAWALWFPERNIDRAVVDPRSLSTPELPLIVDASWGPQTGAMVALMTCMPKPQWHVRDEDPILWAFEHRQSWSLPNGVNFRQCVRQQSETGAVAVPGAPETQRGKASADILERKLSDYLILHGCRRQGAESCLPLLIALESLSPSHPALVAIMKAIEPEFAPSVIPAPDEIHAARRSAMRKLIFLTAKLPVLLSHERDWPVGEVERSLRAVLALTKSLQAPLNAGGFPNAAVILDFFGPANAWRRLPDETAMPASVARLLTRLGHDSAATPGCLETPLNVPGMPVSFWIGYAEQKLAREHTACGLLSLTQIARSYAGDRPELLEPVRALRRFLDTPGPAREEIIADLAGVCSGSVDGHPDPWQVCSELARRKAVEVARQREAEALATREAEKLAKLDQTCAPEVFESIGALLQIADFANAGKQAVGASVCKRLPGAQSIVLVAMLYKTGSDANLVVAMFDEKSGKVVSTYTAPIVEDATMSVNGARMHIDTARYDLAPGVRAFGVDIHSGYLPSCGDGGYDGIRTLLVRDGEKLRPVLDLTLSTWQIVERGNSRCSNVDVGTTVIATQTSTITVAKTVTNGYADLLITTVSKYDDEKRRKPRATGRTLLRYDGKKYPNP
jgi:hypothetical protein